MVKLDDDDQDSTRFLWPKDPLNPDSPFHVYEFKAVLFGGTCSQFLLNSTTINIQDHKQIIKKLRRGLYIDNLQGTGDQMHEILEQSNVTLRSFAQAHLYLREWVSNCKQLQDVVTLGEVAAVNQTKVKTLGIRWNTESDQLSLQSKTMSSRVTTKREALSVTASVFDRI